MKTLASELQRFQNLHNEAAFPQTMEDMMRLIEHQARLLDEARGSAETIDGYLRERRWISAKSRISMLLSCLDPNQPMSEEQAYGQV